MGEARNIRLLRTAVGILVGFWLMFAAVQAAYLGFARYAEGLETSGVVILLMVGPLLELCTHLIGTRTRGLGRGVIMGIFIGMVVGGILIAKNYDALRPAFYLPPYVFLAALFIAWLRDRFSPNNKPGNL
jgi:hypothetical protein